jgi:ABC-2 type transport system permease protein
LLLTFPIAITANYLGDPDNGAILAGYLGSLLLAGAYLAVTSLTSAITRNQVIAFILAVTGCLFLVLAGWPPVTQVLTSWAPAAVVDFVAGFSVMTHFDSIQRGVLDTGDLVYFASVIVFGLAATDAALKFHRGG